MDERTALEMAVALVEELRAELRDLTQRLDAAREDLMHVATAFDLPADPVERIAAEVQAYVCPGCDEYEGLRSALVEIAGDDVAEDDEDMEDEAIAVAALERTETLRAVAAAAQAEHRARAAWLATLPPCAGAPVEVAACERATAAALVAAGWEP